MTQSRKRKQRSPVEYRNSAVRFSLLVHHCHERCQRAIRLQIDEYDSAAKLRRIADDPRRFQISVVLACIEHMAIITLAMMLFAAFSSDNKILGIVWVVARTAEGTIQLFSESGFWGLLRTVRQYAGAPDAEKTVLADSGRAILKTRNVRYLEYDRSNQTPSP